ncbi:sulfatase-like hydrolase/transferase [Novipirellula artificiosorum]|uniref:sulfatase-like hydrolase/transferase n=1 Tax=Novipirellula artificiosorum TaxID=2528016 RepID=UPI0018CCCAB2|nr:sulfatase-like hydrolase/transferase [Novipirellula artificiosorum]
MTSRNRIIVASLVLLLSAWSGFFCVAQNYPIVDTGQERAYDNRIEIVYPKSSEPFFGQDAQYEGNQPSYRDNGDGTITDLVTGLMWQKDPGPKKTLDQAIAGAPACRLAEYDDWRLPSIKELYSLILFSGEDVNPQLTDTSGLKPFINTEYFDFSYGDPAKGERIIDSQMATSTKYVSTTMNGSDTVFGVNFADGRIKGYPASIHRPGRGAKGFFVFYVRGNPDYGKNIFCDNGDGTITDEGTDLTWMQLDSGHLKAGKSKDGKLNWEQSLQWAENLEYAGHSDWRLPNIKELQSIVDYSRSPDTSNSAAIDPLFRVTPIRDGLGDLNYPFYWSSTSHLRDGGNASTGCYVAFGRSQGWMQGRSGGQYNLLDVHGAGSQRSDPKAGDPTQFPHGRGPQGDVIEIYNMVRAVRGGDVTTRSEGPELEPQREMPQRSSNRPSEGMMPSMRGNPQQGNMRGGRRPLGERNAPGDGQLREPNDRSSLESPASEWPTDTGHEARANAALKELPPSFVFILADDMGWTGLSTSMDRRIPNSKSDFYQTPRIDELARQGMRFSNAYSPSSLCTPSRGSILTGKSPALTRITTPGRASGQSRGNHKLIPPRHVDALPESETTIAEVLQNHGYSTAHFGKWHLNGGGPGYHGFDTHDGDTGNGGGGEYEDPNPKDIFGITDRGIAFMRQQVAQRKPFYLQLSHYAVHSPPKALAATKSEYEQKPSGARHSSVIHAAMTRDLDTGVGMILDSIERLGIAENTYVIFMSDNGAPAGPRKRSENMPLSGGKATFWEGGIRVPLIIRGPDVPSDATCHERVVGFDLFPTLCDLAGGIEIPDDVEGGSLTSMMTSNPMGMVQRPSPDLVFHFPHYAQGAEQYPQSAIYQGDFKLLRIYETKTNHLFKLSDDIGELNDLAKNMPEKVAKMEKDLFAYFSEVEAQMPIENPNYVPEASPPSGRASGGRSMGGEERSTGNRQGGAGRPNRRPRRGS